MGDKDYMVLEDLVEELVEVKSGDNLGKHDINQLEDILQQNKNKITYIVYDKNSSLSKELIQKGIKVMTPSELSSYNLLEKSLLNGLFSYKENFKNYAEKNNDKLGQFEADLFSLYLWIKEQKEIKEDLLIKALDSIYKQDDALKEELARAYNIKWLSVNQYERESLKVFSKERGRHFDLELAKKKLKNKIKKIENEIQFYKGKYGDYLLRKRNFKKLEKLIEKTPLSECKYNAPSPFILYYSKEKPIALLVYKNNGKEIRFELNGVVKLHRKKIEEWIEEGKIMEKKRQIS